MSETPGQPVQLVTERLVLTGHEAADFAPLAAMWSDPETMRHVGGPRSETDSWARLLRYRGLWPVLGYGFWAVREKASGRFAGDLGFADFHRVLAPPHDCVPEAGWVFAGWARGRGYAHEALAAALGWLDGTRLHATCHCLIDAQNAPSLRLAGRQGFSHPRSVVFKDTPTLLLTRHCPSGTAASNS
jgi:RimJ/RimL family protein N-acetyltransferase